jgi:hypothetical protein
MQYTRGGMITNNGTTSLLPPVPWQTNDTMYHSSSAPALLFSCPIQSMLYYTGQLWTLGSYPMIELYCPQCGCNTALAQQRLQQRARALLHRDYEPIVRRLRHRARLCDGALGAVAGSVWSLIIAVSLWVLLLNLEAHAVVDATALLYGSAPALHWSHHVVRLLICTLLALPPVVIAIRWHDRAISAQERRLLKQIELQLHPAYTHATASRQR